MFTHSPPPPLTIQFLTRIKHIFSFKRCLKHSLVHLRKAILRPRACTPRSNPNQRQSRKVERTPDHLSARQTKYERYFFYNYNTMGVMLTHETGAGPSVFSALGVQSQQFSWQHPW